MVRFEQIQINLSGTSRHADYAVAAEIPRRRCQSKIIVQSAFLYSYMLITAAKQM